MPLRRCLSLPLSARIGTRSAAMLARCDAVRCRRCGSQTAGIGGWCFQKFCATLPSCGCPMPQYRERRRREYCHQQADSVFCDGLQHRSAAGMTVKRRRLCSACPSGYNLDGMSNPHDRLLVISKKTDESWSVMSASFVTYPSTF